MDERVRIWHVAHSRSAHEEIDVTLMGRLMETLTTHEQRMFLDGFKMYLKHNARKDFVVDLEDAYVWIGYTRKDHAKTAMGKSPEEGRDYVVISGSFSGARN